MSFAWKGMLALFWLLAVPAASGSLFFRKKESPTRIDRFLAGYLFLFSSAEILILLMMYLKLPLHVLIASYGLLAALAAVLGALRARKLRGSWARPQSFASDAQMPDGPSGDPQDPAPDAQMPDGPLRKPQDPAPDRPSREPQGSRFARAATFLRGSSPFLWAALLVIAFQIGVVVLFAHFDADDALYVATATTAVETDSIFRFNAYTGAAYRALPRRYILSPFQIFLAVVSQLCGGLHPAIMAHTVFPAVFLICVYLVLFRLGQRWFPKDRNAQGIFLFLAAVLCWFSAYSVYNTGSFQMVRLWQGKAVLASFLLPLTFYLCASVMLEQKPLFSWLLPGMANLSCCLLSSMGIILAPLMMGLFIVLGFCRFRSLKRAALGFLCCLPSVALGVTYLLL